MKALLFLLLITLLAFGNTAKCQSIDIELYNATPGITFDGVVAWTHPSATDELEMGNPSQPLIDLSRSLPAKPFAETVAARSSTAGFVHSSIPLLPGAVMDLRVDTRSTLHRSFSLVLPLDGHDGFVFATGRVSLSQRFVRVIGFAWEARGHVGFHSSLGSPMLVATARFRSGGGGSGGGAVVRKSDEPNGQPVDTGNACTRLKGHVRVVEGKARCYVCTETNADGESSCQHWSVPGFE